MTPSVADYRATSPEDGGGDDQAASFCSTGFCTKVRYTPSR